MTKVVLHGNLANVFGRDFKCKVSSIKEVFNFLEANRPGFYAKLQKLSKQGMHYAIIADGEKLSKLNQIENIKKIKRIDIVPAVVGSGPIAVGIGATIATIGLSTAFAAGTISMTTFIIASVVVAVVSMALQMMLAPKPPTPPAIESTTRALEQSFTFANKDNIAAQGSQIPFGYGRLLCPTFVIESSTKNYPQNIRANQIFSDGIKDDYLVSSQPNINNTITWPTETPPEYDGWGDNQIITNNGTTLYDPDTSHGNEGPLIFRCWESLSFAIAGYYSITTHVPQGGFGLQRFALWSRAIGTYAQSIEAPTIATSGTSAINGVQRWYFSYANFLGSTESRSREYYLTLYPTTVPNPETNENILGRFTITNQIEIKVIEFLNGFELSGNCSTVSYPPCNDGLYINYLSTPQEPRAGWCPAASNKIANFNCGVDQIGGNFTAGGSLIQGAKITYGETPQG